MIKLLLYYLKRFLKSCEAEYIRADIWIAPSDGEYHFDGVITWEP